MQILKKIIKQILKLLPILLIISVGTFIYVNNKNIKTTYETKVQTVSKGSLKDITTISGSIKPTRQVNLYSKATQTKVNEILVSVGEKIVKDQVIAKFSTNIWADRELVSPIDGIITNLNLYLDETPSYQNPVITINSEKLYAELEVSEYDIDKIKLDQKVTLHFDKFDKTGKISEIAINPTTSTQVSQNKNVTYTVKVELDNQDNLKNGFTFDADIIIQSKDNVLKISSSALKTNNGKNSVEVEKLVESKDKDGKIVTEKVFETKIIEVGINNDNEAEIISGLAEGETVVLEKKEVKTTTGFNFFK